MEPVKNFLICWQSFDRDYAIIRQFFNVKETYEQISFIRDVKTFRSHRLRPRYWDSKQLQTKQKRIFEDPTMFAQRNVSNNSFKQKNCLRIWRYYVKQVVVNCLLYTWPYDLIMIDCFTLILIRIITVDYCFSCILIWLRYRLLL